MKQNNIKNWKYSSDLENLLFTAQRLDEVLFFYTHDTYKANVMNTKMLIDEFLEVRDSIDAGLLKEKNDEPVISEFLWSLAKDTEAKKIIGEKIVEDLKKNIGSLSIKEKVKYFRYLQAKLLGSIYFDTIKKAFEKAVKEEKKNEIDRLILQFVCEAKNQGYSARYIHKCVHEIFFGTEVNSYRTIELFLERFNGIPQNYTVYVVVNEEIGKICINLMHALREVKIELLERKDIPNEIVNIVDNTVGVLKFENIEALDNYSAVEFAHSIVKTMGHFYAFYRHNIETITLRGYVSSENGKVEYVRPEVTGIKKSAKVGSFEKAKTNASEVFDIARSSPMNFYFLSRIMEIHNIAFGVDSPTNSLLDLWSIFELLLEKENDSESNGKSRIFQIIDMIEPFIKGGYVEQIIDTVKKDIKRWNERKYNEILTEVNIDIDDNGKIFAFVALDEYDDLRKKVYSELNTFPLLRYRIFSLNEKFKHGKQIKKILLEHEKKTAWHIQRIYRARNCIIHDGENVQHVESLVENLHSYIDILCSWIIRLLNANMNQSVMDAVYEMFLKERMYEIYIEKTEPSKDNINEFLLSN